MIWVQVVWFVWKLHDLYKSRDHLLSIVPGTSFFLLLQIWFFRLPCLQCIYGFCTFFCSCILTFFVVCFAILRFFFLLYGSCSCAPRLWRGVAGQRPHVPRALNGSDPHEAWLPHRSQGRLDRHTLRRRRWWSGFGLRARQGERVGYWSAYYVQQYKR